MAFCERQQKQFAIRKSLFERTFCAPCTSTSVERVFNNGVYLLCHTDASKAQCEKLLSLDLDLDLDLDNSRQEPEAISATRTR